jgi:hypothetical protein
LAELKTGEHKIKGLYGNNSEIFDTFLIEDSKGDFHCAVQNTE